MKQPEINTQDLTKDTTSVMEQSEVDLVKDTVVNISGQDLLDALGNRNKVRPIVNTPEQIKKLAFMEEPMTILLHENADPNAEDPVTVGNNGKFVAFFRGKPTLTKRKFVSGLIVKVNTITTDEGIIPGTIERVGLIRTHSAHKYPFQIIEDKNPRGSEWVSKRFAEAM